MGKFFDSEMAKTVVAIVLGGAALVLLYHLFSKHLSVVENVLPAPASV